MSIVLIGYRGSGKTTIGRKLAERLQSRFVDADDLIVQRAGQSIRDIFQKHGEAHFRDLESGIVQEISLLQDHVIALGGGAVMRPENRAALLAAKHTVIHLRCDEQVLLRRIQGDPATGANRPSLTALGGGIDEIRKLLAERSPIYRSTMTAELDVTNLTPAEATNRIVQLLKLSTN